MRSTPTATAKKESSMVTDIKLLLGTKRFFIYKYFVCKKNYRDIISIGVTIQETFLDSQSLKSLGDN